MDTHYIDNPFAMMTDVHEQALKGATPCAKSLYQYFLKKKPAGYEQELELEDYQQYSQGIRDGGYSIRQIKRAFDQLKELELIRTTKDYRNSRSYKIIAYHPQQDKNVIDPDKNVKIRTKKSHKRDSKLHSSVPLNKEDKKTTKHPPTHHAAVIVENIFLNQSTNQVGEDSLSTSIEDRTLKQVEEAIAPKKINETIIQLIKQSSPETVKAAIHKTSTENKKGTLRNPAGYFVRCLQNPSICAVVDEKSQFEGFDEWYELAHKAKIIERCATPDPRTTGLPEHTMGVIRVNSGRWEDWRDIADKYPLERLKKILRGYEQQGIYLDS